MPLRRCRRRYSGRLITERVEGGDQQGRVVGARAPGPPIARNVSNLWLKFVANIVVLGRLTDSKSRLPFSISLFRTCLLSYILLSCFRNVFYCKHVRVTYV